MNNKPLRSCLTKSSMAPPQRKIADIIERLGFGVIARLPIQDGLPSFQPEPHITQEVRFGSDSGGAAPGSAGDTLKKEFVDLFTMMAEVREGFVNIEVRHSLPFRIVRERRHSEFG